MERAYAVVQAKNGEADILYQTPDFDAQAVVKKLELSDGKQLWISGQDALIRANQELSRRLQAAEEANVAKETFLSNMSHDIRTPMNAIVGMTALAKKHIDEKARVAAALDKIEVASAHLLSLINEVLDMSRINSGRLLLAKENFVLGDLLHDILTIVNPQMEQKKHTFQFTVGDILAESLIGDPLRLRQVFVNIINNAVKYTPDEGKIEVSIHQEKAGDKMILHFLCRDNGIGMTKEFLQRIFVPFERVNSSTLSKIEGTGLGMSIVKKLIENMDGEISIESEPGKGTAVMVRIPMACENLRVETANLSNKRLLIIEADPTLQATYRQYLDEFKLTYAIAASSEEAISALTDADFRGSGFDAVIIGNRVQGVDDIFDLSGYLKKAYGQLRVILISEDDWNEIEYRARRSGIEHFIPVPFFRKSLINGLNQALQQEGGREDLFGSPDLTGKRILLAEDNDINREIALELLKSTNAETDSAVNGQEALDRFLQSPEGHYDLILMDIQMPVMDGYTAVKRIRESSRSDAGTVRIIAMTANAFAEDIAKAREAGMNGHLAKPIDIHTFMQTLRQIQ
jgi:signal transduction histidine kinase/DNA-binding response OmpR family regulator